MLNIPKLGILMNQGRLGQVAVQSGCKSGRELRGGCSVQEHGALLARILALPGVNARRYFDGRNIRRIDDGAERGGPQGGKAKLETRFCSLRGKTQRAKRGMDVPADFHHALAFDGLVRDPGITDKLTRFQQLQGPQTEAVIRVVLGVPSYPAFKRGCGVHGGVKLRRIRIGEYWAQGLEVFSNISTHAEASGLKDVGRA